MKKRSISIVVPCYNEEEVFPFLSQAMSRLADELADRFEVEIILIDDGSTDTTWGLINALASDDPRFRGVSLSRNFGHQFALSCGYDLASGEAVVCMDADLQDPPEVVKQMLQEWEKGADVVLAIRSRREGETRFKLWTARLFYWLFNRISGTNLASESGDFRLLSRRALLALRQLREQHRFVRGMVGWIGFNSVELHYERNPRVAGKTKYPFLKMLRLAVDAAVSFSFYPLRISYIAATLLAVIFLSYLGYSVILAILFGREVVKGWPSLILVTIAFGSANLFCLGVLGEYLGRIYEQSKQRPLYLLRDDTRPNGEGDHE